MYSYSFFHPRLFFYNCHRLPLATEPRGSSEGRSSRKLGGKRRWTWMSGFSRTRCKRGCLLPPLVLVRSRSFLFFDFFLPLWCSELNSPRPPSWGARSDCWCLGGSSGSGGGLEGSLLALAPTAGSSSSDSLSSPSSLSSSRLGSLGTLGGAGGGGGTECPRDAGSGRGVRLSRAARESSALFRPLEISLSDLTVRTAPTTTSWHRALNPSQCQWALNSKLSDSVALHPKHQVSSDLGVACLHLAQSMPDLRLKRPHQRSESVTLGFTQTVQVNYLPTSAKKLLRSPIAGHPCPTPSLSQRCLQCGHLGFPGIFDTPKMWHDLNGHIVNGNICVQAIPRPFRSWDFTKSHLLQGFTILLKSGLCAACSARLPQGSNHPNGIKMVSKGTEMVSKRFQKYPKGIEITSTLDKAEYLVVLPFCLVWVFWVSPCLDFFCRVLMFSASTYSHVTVTSLVVARINVDIWWYLCIVRVEPQKGVTRSSESWDTTYCVSLSANFQEYQPMASFNFVGSFLSTHQMRCFAISHWILRLGHNLQGSSRQKSRFALFCGVLRLVCVHVSVLNVSLCC